MVERAKDLIQNLRKYDRVTSAGSAAYVQNISFDRTTGEIIDGKELALNLIKIEEESKYDGYYSIVTSELNMSDYILQAKLDNKYPVGKMLQALRKYSCILYCSVPRRFNSFHVLSDSGLTWTDIQVCPL